MAGYLGSTPVPQATQHRESFTATEGQTSFATVGYTPQFLDVFLNGSHLSPADFVATNGSDVVLVVAASADDVCDIVSYTPFEVNSQTFTGTTTMTGAVDMASTLKVAANVAFGGQAPSSAGLTVKANGSGYTNGALELLASNGNSLSYITNVANLLAISDGDGNADAIIVNAAGAVTKPNQPAFFAVPASDQSNFAVNSDVVVVFGTEKFDQGDNFRLSTGDGQNGNGSNLGAQFTAPVTGKYQLNLTILLLNVDSASNYYYAALNTSNNYISAWIDPDSGQDSAQHSISLSVLADMDASDTAVANVRQGSGTQQTSIDTNSYFSGYLVA